MKYSQLALCLLAFFSPLQGESPDSDEIRIYLSTTSPLQPLYVGKINSPDHSFSDTYLAEMQSVLAFDLNFNGTTRVLAPQSDREEALRKGTWARDTWRSLGAAYVVKAEVQGKSLILSCFSAQTGSVKQFPPVPLSGTLSKDRRILHRLSDAIYKTLFDKEGVASTKLLYSVKHRKGDKWISEIWRCDWDGHNPEQITRENNYCITPVFVPSKGGGDRFLYVSYKNGQPKIFISSMSQGSGKRLIDLRGNQLLPAISAQRDKIAFISDAAGHPDLFIQEFNQEKGEVGKPIQLFSQSRSTQASPTFSPDGTKIAFVSDKDGTPRIYLLPASVQGKNSSPKLLTKKNTENSCPSWSPDGKKLAYSAKTKGIRQIWIYDFDTGEEWQLTDGNINKENPSWAPDSKHLVFNSTDGHTSELYLVNLNQPDVVKISSGPGVKHYPTWGTKGI